MDKVEQIIKQFDFLNSRKQSNLSYWQSIANFCHPRKAWQNVIRLPGEALKMTRIYDSTAVRAARVCSAGIYSNLINPATQWHGWQLKDYQYNDNYANKKWFKWLETYVYSVLANTNFYSVNLEAIHDNVTFGTCAVLVLRDAERRIHCQLIPLGQLCLEEDNRKNICAFYRKFKYTAQQAKREWGSQSPKCVQDAIQAKKLNEEFDFIHYVGERENRDVTALRAKNMPFEEFYVSVKDKDLILESGYEEFPLAVSRFYKDESDVFGISPAMIVMAEVMGINYKHWAIDRAAAKAIDPAYLTPADGFQTPLNGNPGIQNLYDRSKVTKEMLGSLPFHGNIPIGIDNINRDAEAIKDGFFVPLFQAVLNVTKQMTAAETQQRVAEGMSLLAPVVNRKTDEFLSPQLKRILSILARNYPHEFMAPPPGIAGRDVSELDAIYQSPLIRAQKLSNLNSLASFWQVAQTIIAVSPESQDKIDMDAAIDVVAEATSVDPKIMRESDAVEGIRQSRLQQQAKIAKLQQAQAIADVAQTGAGAMRQGAEADKVMAGT